MARRLFILALALLLSVFSASAADFKRISCENVWAKITVDGPIALKGDLQLEAGASANSHLEPRSVEITRDRVTCNYNLPFTPLTAKYSYKIPHGWYCKNMSDTKSGRHQRFEVTCHDLGSR